ncbi:histidine kinase [Streptomyces sp. H10-C2]|uniref:histidine kinase n=1 Tax=unclassified Streptomyces TaxID=2593676 RepID=UPI0024B8E033|nr:MULTISPECIES: histidine kinase [unclassified Streptomyces]MDJ0341340.1 histidine kinase [Streptomyces sp. PH10-H1]MDJ0370935.1 histidine kinase [Streptomyces sp. H10-C2]
MSTTGAHVPEDRGGGRARSGPWWWPRRRSLVLDATLAAVSALECFVEGVSFAQKTGIAPGVGAVFGLLVGSTLLLRRRWPIPIVLLSIAVTPAQLGYLLGVVSLYTLAASEVPRRITATLAGMTGVGTMIVAFIQMRDSLRLDNNTPLLVIVITSVLMALGLTAPPVLLGLYVRARRRLVESLRERADGLERELTLLAEKATERAERARADERTRIAREMHDVVAHRVSLMVVHAAALKAVALKDPEKASASAELLGNMGRQALNELRQMLGVLRTGPGVNGAGAGSTLAFTEVGSGTGGGSGSAAPVTAGSGGPDGLDGLDGSAAPGGDGPCLARLEALVGESRAAGMRVALTVEGEIRACAAQVERTAYRVVQEALTNVHKHASGARTQVRLAYRATEVAVRVENGPSDGSPAAALPSGGHGLVGMKERVTALGGGFVAGHTADGGFRVSAMIPALPAAVPTGPPAVC